MASPSGSMNEMKRRRFNPYPAGVGPNSPRHAHTSSGGGHQPSPQGYPHALSQQHQQSPEVEVRSIEHGLPYTLQPPHSAGAAHMRSISNHRNSLSGQTPTAATMASISTRPTPLMGPPPRPRTMLHAQPHTPISASGRFPISSSAAPPAASRSRQGSDALRLPPLQTSGAAHPPGQQPKSLEATLASLSFIAKIKLIGKIAIPLSQQARLSALPQARTPHHGAIITVEGDDAAATAAAARDIHAALARMGDFEVHAWPGPALPPTANASMVDVMELVQGWHRKAPEIRRLLRGEDGGGSDAMEVDAAERRPAVPEDTRRDSSMSGMVSPHDRRQHGKPDGEERGTKRKSSAISGEEDEQEAARKSSRGSSSASPSRSPRSTSPSSTTPGPSTTTNGNGAGKIPVLLIPQYILHACDVWAAAVRCADMYSPSDHWQWLATLWRGVVGADFTVYVRGGSQDAADSASAVSPRHQQQQQQQQSPPQTSVEIRPELGTMVLRTAERSGRVDTGAVRRCAFEVGEWVRALSARLGE